MASNYTVTVTPPATTNKSPRALHRWRVISHEHRPELGPDNVVAQGTGRTEEEARLAGFAARQSYDDHDAEARRKQAIEYITELAKGCRGVDELLVLLGADGWLPLFAATPGTNLQKKKTNGNARYMNIQGNTVRLDGAHVVVFKK